MDTPSPAAKLTARQQQIFDLILAAIRRTGAPPTRAEIASELGFRSANAAEEHLQALARKGVLELVSGTSRGIRLKSDVLRSLHRQETPEPSHIGSNAMLLPLVGRVAAGAPILAQEHVEQMFRVDGSLFSQTPDYLLKVKGLSMRDAGILDGDLLAVCNRPTASNGQIVVARVGDDVTVKRFHRHGQAIELRAENPDFPPIRVQPTDRFAIEGLAVGLIRKSMEF